MIIRRLTSIRRINTIRWFNSIRRVPMVRFNSAIHFNIRHGARSAMKSERALAHDINEPHDKNPPYLYNIIYWSNERIILLYITEMSIYTKYINMYKKGTIGIRYIVLFFESFRFVSKMLYSWKYVFVLLRCLHHKLLFLMRLSIVVSFSV